MFLRNRLLCALALGCAAGSLAPAAAHASEFEFWNGCPAVLASPAAHLIHGLDGLCGRYTFVVGRNTPAEKAKLHMIRPLSELVPLKNGQPLLFLDTDSPVATLNLAAAYLATPQDAGALALLSWATGGLVPPLDLGPPPPITTEILADAQLWEVAQRLGFQWRPDDGIELFASVGLISVPELGLTLISASLTPNGREFFRSYLAAGHGLQLDGILSWRVDEHFTPDLTASSVGTLPCVVEGPRPIRRQDLANIDPILLKLPIDLSNMTQLVHCH